MKPRLSLTARIAWVFALFAALVLAMVGFVIERAVALHFDDLDRHDLGAHVAAVRNLLSRTDSEERFDALAARLDDVLVGHEMVAARIHGADGTPLYALRAGVFDHMPPVADEGGLRRWRHDDHEYIARDALFDVPLAAPRRVEALIALDITHHTHFLDMVRNRLWLAISLAALAAAALGWFAARRGLAPLRRITATASGLSAARLDERLSLHDAPAEVQALVEAFNGMLDRLEEAFRRLDAYSADIAHELRTPVSNLMTATEVALTRARSAEEYRDTLHSNLEEFERMARMISDMLFLAKADQRRLPRAAEAVALADEAQALAEFYEALAEERGVAIRVSGAASVTGDRLMLRRALSNLLSNALRHARSESCIDIVIASDARHVRLSVANAGEDIAPDRVANLFERFHRIEGERERHGEGAGLGLAITRSIVEAHGGRIEVESVDGLTRFTLHLSRAQTEPKAVVTAP
ncbi:heavy metal sensor histidine kinase [Pseudazoarcus pumilus]|uniref:Sensor protein n=1 Tax=Pseudazoarcus pumilus TaxID=2067960 RepID=A0A2I6S962_9RHOO|nr:heavy metal sensor histidine kinase [Pseudazoarcus pumilus]AUN95806.1 two-component sensor histidine kinase [Pseudazoarcus pumilus]